MHFLFSMAETVCVSLFSLKISNLCNSCHYGCQLKITKDNFDITVNAEMFHIKTRPNIQKPDSCYRTKADLHSCTGKCDNRLIYWLLGIVNVYYVTHQWQCISKPRGYTLIDKELAAWMDIKITSQHFGTISNLLTAVVAYVLLMIYWQTAVNYSWRLSLSSISCLLSWF